MTSEREYKGSAVPKDHSEVDERGERGASDRFAQVMFCAGLPFGIATRHGTLFGAAMQEVPWNFMFGGMLTLFLVLGTLLFNAGIIPNYLLVRYLGMLNTYQSLIVPGLISAFNLVVVRQFFMNIPADLIDAAMMDGANPFQIFWQIILPLSKAVLAVVALFYGVALWSDYFHPLLYLNNTAMWPIPLVLRLYVLQGQALSGAVQVGQPLPPATTVQMAVVILATLPILVVYPFLQRYFTQGVLAGAIKG